MQWKCLQNDIRVSIKFTFGWFLIWQHLVSVRVSDIQVRKLWMKHSRMSLFRINRLLLRLHWYPLTMTIFTYYFSISYILQLFTGRKLPYKLSYIYNPYGADIFVHLPWNEQPMNTPVLFNYLGQFFSYFIILTWDIYNVCVLGIFCRECV